MMNKIQFVILEHVSTDVRGDQWVDVVGASIAILKLYEGDRYEDVMRGGTSVALKGGTAQERET